MRRELYEDEHEAFRVSVHQFLKRSVIPHVQAHAEQKSLPRDFWLEAGANGLLGLEIPEEYGGLGARDYRFNAVASEELNKVNAALGSCWGIHADIAAPYLVDLGTEEQKQRWLPGVASGEILLAIAMTEPSGGSDLAGLRTSAVRDGDTWVINGSKTFITNGDSADLVITAVRTDPAKRAHGITLPQWRALAEISRNEGMTQSEIAKRLGISQMHVSRLLSRSLQRLREVAEE